MREAPASVALVGTDVEIPSVLDDLGEEITGIIWPVSICMAITIFLVKVLNPEGVTSAGTVIIASAAYDENSHAAASDGEKLGGALLNAIIFIAVITVMTLVLVLLFKYGCYRVIFAYMGFAVMNIFFLITALLIIMLCQVGRVHVDAFSLCYILFNFSVVGTLGVLVMPIPLLLKQGYMIWTGVIIAYIFTWIPDWTSWVLLVAMALYDIAAVLIPGGPLKMLVELAVERQQALPALLYESRPNAGYRGPNAWMQRRQEAAAEGDPEHGPIPGEQEMERVDRNPSQQSIRENEASAMTSANDNLHQRPQPGRDQGHAIGEGQEDKDIALGVYKTLQEDAEDIHSHLPARSPPHTDSLLNERSSSLGGGSNPVTPVRHGSPTQQPEHEKANKKSESSVKNMFMGLASTAVSPAPVPSSHAMAGSPPPGDGANVPPSHGGPPAPAATQRPQQEEEDEGLDIPDGVKLGLGDFIFYSMLVGKAAMYDIMTVFSSFIGIIAGLGLTLLCLALFKRALPALPFSIALGVAFYFLTRIILEPLMTMCATHGTFF